MPVLAHSSATQEMHSLAWLGQGCQPCRKGFTLWEVVPSLYTFVYQTSQKSTLRCRFLAQLLTTSVPFAISVLPLAVLPVWS